MRVQVDPARMIMKLYNCVQKALQAFKKLFDLISPDSEHPRKLLKQTPAYTVFEHTIIFVGGCMLTQAIGKKLKSDQTLETELITVKKFWRDAELEMPLPFKLLIERNCS